MKPLYRFQVLDREHQPSPESHVLMDIAVNPPEGYVLREWKVNRHGSIVVCWCLNTYEQMR